MNLEEVDDIKTLFVKVILPLPLETFTYRIPRTLNDKIKEGQLIAVLFGRKNKKLYGAIVAEVSEKGPKNYQASYIQEIVDETPLLSVAQLQFWKWMSKYYMCKLGDVMVAALPAGLRLSGETRIFLNPKELISINELTPEEISIISYLENNAYATASLLEKHLEIKNPLRYIRSLYDKNLVLVAEDIKSNQKPKTKAVVSLAFNKSNEVELEKAFEAVQRSTKQAEMLLYLINQGGKVDKKNLLKATGLSSSIAQGLLKKSIIEIHSEEITRFALEENENNTIQLNDEQKLAVSAIEKGFVANKPALLFGPTASGKTYVYLDLIKKALKEGKQVLYLLPEIALTEQVIIKLKQFLGEEVLVTHSKYSLQERAEIWELLRSKAINVIIGPRSSIFSPFYDLGLIIVDEEHEPSFKQNEKSPRFHGRDSALVLAKLWNANIVLGSATPSIESMYSAISGKFTLVKLMNKFTKTGSINFKTLNFKSAVEKNKLHDMFSFEMIEHLKKVLNEKRQAIIFHNRKGFVPETNCLSCGWVPQCPNCDISLTYYKYNQVMRCHYCGFKSPPPTECADCGSHQLQLEGYGTEKITEVLQGILPEHKIERFDQESTKKKKAHKEIMQRFKSGETEILVGTQLLAKGFDFENVDFVGVVNADHMLYFPDFRSGERTFQLLTQVAGRTGRHDNQGEVMLQSYRPDHPILQSIINTDYKYMYETELEDRENFLYPPFTRLILIQIKDFDALVAEKASRWLGQMLKDKLGHRVIGPSKPPISKINRWYIREILIKIDKKKDHLTSIKSEVNAICLNVRTVDEYKKTRVLINVDPN